MKRVLTTSVVAGLLGTLGFAPVASAVDATLYGSIRSGIMVKNPDAAGEDTVWDIGATDAGDLDSADRLFSRIGVKASQEIGAGMMAGMTIEKRLDNFRTRHQNVWLESAAGRITLGQQGSPYQGNTSWDPAWFTGGSYEQIGSRKSGVSYASNLGGPFDFSAMIVDDNSEMKENKKTGYGDGLDKVEIGGTLSLGSVSVGAGYADDDMSTTMGAKVGGSFANIGWAVGFETMDYDADGKEDTKHGGFNLTYSHGEGKAYYYFSDVSDMKGMKGNDGTTWSAGYAYGLGAGVSVVAEHRDTKDDGTLSIVAVVVSF